MRARPGPIALVVAVVLALTACTADPAPPQPSATGPALPSASPVPSASPPEEPTAAPVSAFGGDCTTIIADPTPYVGELEAVQPHLASGFWTLGGLGCSWRGATGYMTVQAAPVEDMPAYFRENFSEPVCDSSLDYDFSCAWVFDAASAGIYLRIVPSSQDGWIARTADDLRPLADEIIRAADSAPAPRGLDRTAEWWAVDACESLEQSVAITAILGTTDYYQGIGTSWEPDLAWLASDEQGTERFCPWTRSVDGGIFIMSLLPGGAWMWDDLLGADARPFDVEGAEAAALVGEGDYEQLYATDGVNVLRVGLSPVAREQAAAALLAELG